MTRITKQYKYENGNDFYSISLPNNTVITKCTINPDINSDISKDYYLLENNIDLYCKSHNTISEDNIHNILEIVNSANFDHLCNKEVAVKIQCSLENSGLYYAERIPEGQNAGLYYCQIVVGTDDYDSENNPDGNYIVKKRRYQYNSNTLKFEEIIFNLNDDYNLFFNDKAECYTWAKGYYGQDVLINRTDYIPFVNYIKKKNGDIEERKNEISSEYLYPIFLKVYQDEERNYIHEFYWFEISNKNLFENSLINEEDSKNGDIINFSIKTNLTDAYIKVYWQQKISDDEIPLLIESNKIQLNNGYFEWNFEDYVDNLGYRLTNNNKLNKLFGIKIFDSNNNEISSLTDSDKILITYTLLVFD